MRVTTLFLAAIAAFVVTSQPVFAHHGGAAFDQTKTVTFTGTVTEMTFANPHVLIYWDVKDGESAGVNWSGWLTAPMAGCSESRSVRNSAGYSIGFVQYPR